VNESGNNSEFYSLVPRLFRLINELSDEQQYHLLHQLYKGKLKTALFKAVIDLSDAQRSDLINQLERMPADTPPPSAFSLNADDSLMRGHRRKRCLLSATYTTQGKVYTDYILDISTVGVFIETDHAFAVDQKMVVTFKLPTYAQPLKLDAAVAWIGHKGIGIRFKSLSPFQEDIIQSYIEKEENV
jgi:Tfp pilus assembly protein PilZ